jgi:ribosomal-protein-alanine N-acetyltransferase
MIRRTFASPPRTQWFLPVVSIHPASESDYPAIARIQQACPEAAQWPVGDYSGFSVLLALADGVPAGFCAWRTVSGEAELLNLGVDPARRRQGIGSALLTQLREKVEGDIFLEVAANNAPALALYHKDGWERIGNRPGYYQRGRIDAVVMKKSSW